MYTKNLNFFGFVAGNYICVDRKYTEQYSTQQILVQKKFHLKFRVENVLGSTF